MLFRDWHLIINSVALNFSTYDFRKGKASSTYLGMYAYGKP